jgi:hypothetical protein
MADLTPNEQRDAIASAFLTADDKTMKFMENQISSDVTDDEAELAYNALHLSGPEKTKPERRSRMMNILGHSAPPGNEKQYACRVLLTYVSNVKVRNIYRKIFGHNP